MTLRRVRFAELLELGVPLVPMVLKVLSPTTKRQSLTSSIVGVDPYGEVSDVGGFPSDGSATLDDEVSVSGHFVPLGECILLPVVTLPSEFLSLRPRSNNNSLEKISRSVQAVPATIEIVHV